MNINWFLMAANSAEADH